MNQVQIRHKNGKLVWNMKTKAGWRWTTTQPTPQAIVSGEFKPVYEEDKERVTKGVKAHKEKDPFRKIGNAYLTKLYWAALKISQCAKAKRISLSDISEVLQRAYQDYLTEGSWTKYVSWSFQDQAVAVVAAPKDHYVVLTFGKAAEGDELFHPPTILAPYLRNKCLDRWFPNIRENILDQGCYTFILSEDVLWGLVFGGFQAAGRIGEGSDDPLDVSAPPTSDSEIKS